MLEFYDNNMSVCAQKVRLALVEKQIAFNRHSLNLRAGDQFDPQYLKLNPKAVVPTIVDDGHAITESSIIIEYLDDAYPDPSLRPASPLLRSEVRRWVVLPDISLHIACGRTSFALAFRKQFDHLDAAGLARHIASIPDPDNSRRERIRNLIQLGLEAPGLADAVASYARSVRAMAEPLRRSEWLVGDDYSLADITMLPYVLRMEHLKLDWVWADSPSITRWLGACKARANYAAISDYLDASYLELMGNTPAADHEWIRTTIEQDQSRSV